MHTGRRNFQNALNAMPAGRHARCVTASRCTVEVNQPQWIPVQANTHGNMEWHILRAMHLAGRCISCGECGRACPVGIPCHLLTMQLTDQVYNYFKVYAGTSDKMSSVLSTFEPNDKESFII